MDTENEGAATGLPEAPDSDVVIPDTEGGEDPTTVAPAEGTDGEDEEENEEDGDEGAAA
jgi:hypothetical protein